MYDPWECFEVTQFLLPFIQHVPYNFGQGQTFVTIERVWHGWARSYKYFDTHSIKENCTVTEQLRYYSLDENSAVTSTDEPNMKIKSWSNLFECSSLYSSYLPADYLYCTSSILFIFLFAFLPIFPFAGFSFFCFYFSVFCFLFLSPYSP